jgi:acetyl-CoA carboxylase carboxyltransferase component/acetyl/propionyl-CoA carboxylase alpha subunit
MRRILIANRGDAALRVARAAADAGVDFVFAYAQDDRSGWMRRGEARPLNGRGPDAYLDIASWLAIADATRCDAVHPGWGFLSERADFARACRKAGLVFIGPTPEQLELFGDKARARVYAASRGVAVAPGIDRPVTLDEARAFFQEQSSAPVMLKAIGGGGGRGLRAAHSLRELETAYARCVSEARRGFASEGVFVERLIAPARHIEVQVAGDGEHVVALGQRDCTLQRRHQKWVEIAPPALPEASRAALDAAALTLARGFCNLGTFEFLVDAAGAFFFMEANPRLQVEHGVTEETTGLDLVRLQFALADGAKLANLGLDAPPPPRGAAIEWRLVAEGGGRLRRFRIPTGPGLRVDVGVEEGELIAAAYDPLLGKLIVRGVDLADAARRSRRALGEWEVEGAPTNLGRLRALADENLAEATFDVGYLDRRIEADTAPASEGAIRAPLSGRLVEIAEAGRIVAGASVAVLEAMKMEHVVAAPASGRLRPVTHRIGDFVAAGAELAFLDDIDGAVAAAASGEVDLNAPRADLARVQARWAATEDAARPTAVAKRHALKLRTARENVADLCDPGSFQEYGAFAVAAQRSRRTLEDLVANTPADGILTGTGLVNSADFGPDRAKIAVLAYDATVLAGTQGLRGHEKTDRLIEIAARSRLPTVLFAEGGGGRPGDTDAAIVAGLHLTTFARFASLSGRAPLIGIVAGRCFAGNAALLGCCDAIISTRDANIGMGGPAMIEGGGLGVYRPEEIGPAAMQAENGVVDALVDDERQAVTVAKAYLGFFQGDSSSWSAVDPRRLRAAIPDNRVRVYDMRALIRDVLDEDAMLELRAGYGPGIITALGRVEGRAIGVLANDPVHLGGAIDSAGADKAARFLGLCEAHGLPMLALVDTPGFMVGPEIETQGHVRRCADLFLAAARLTVPYVAVVVRRGYGLGAMAMTGGGFHAPDLIAAWPSGEFGPMGLEGAVRLGFRRELEAAPDAGAREALFRRLLAEQYERGSAINMATSLEIDAVIDPLETRTWISRALAGARRR